MFGLSYNEKIIKKQAEMIDKLERELAFKNGMVDSFVNREKTDAQFEVDFEKINAFSIERIPVGDGQYKTVVGYRRSDETNGEWILWCSLDQHNILVQQFREYIQEQRMTKGKKK